MKFIKKILLDKESQGHKPAYEEDLCNLLVEVDILNNRVDRHNLPIVVVSKLLALPTISVQPRLSFWCPSSMKNNQKSIEFVRVRDLHNVH